jgi:hypothetical protein
MEERERERERACVCVSLYVKERDRMCVGMYSCMFVIVEVGQSVCVGVYVQLGMTTQPQIISVISPVRRVGTHTLLPFPLSLLMFILTSPLFSLLLSSHFSPSYALNISPANCYSDSACTVKPL